VEQKIYLKKKTHTFTTPETYHSQMMLDDDVEHIEHEQVFSRVSEALQKCIQYKSSYRGITGMNW